MAEIPNPITTELIKAPSKYAEELLKAVSAQNALIESSLKLLELNNKIPASDETATKKKKQLTEVEKLANKTRNEQIRLHLQVDKAASREAISIQKTKLALKDKRKAVKDDILESRRSVLSIEAQKGAYNAISKSLSANLVKWKQYTAEQLKTDKRARKLTATIKKQRAELAKADKSTGLAARGVGKYKEGVLSAAKSLFGALGLIGGIAGLVKVMGSAIAISLQFEASMSKVKAISGATASEWRELRNQAKLLGEQTQKDSRRSRTASNRIIENWVFTKTDNKFYRCNFRASNCNR